MSLFPNRNPENFERLKKLPALEAIQVWLDGDFAIDEEDALLHAIRTETKSALSDEQITDLICNAMETEQPAATCLKNIQRGE